MIHKQRAYFVVGHFRYEARAGSSWSCLCCWIFVCVQSNLFLVGRGDAGGTTGGGGGGELYIPAAGILVCRQSVAYGWGVVG